MHSVIYSKCKIKTITMYYMCSIYRRLFLIVICLSVRVNSSLLSSTLETGGVSILIQWEASIANNFWNQLLFLAITDPKSDQ